MRKFMRTRRDPPDHTPLADGGDAGIDPGDRYWSASEERSPANKLWEDPDFEPRVALPSAPRRRIEWLRPQEISARPRFWGDDDATTDSEDNVSARWAVELGEVGSGAVCAAAAALALTPQLLANAVPPQSFRVSYTGRFRFRLWHFDGWRDVYIDDRLPTRAGRLLASRSALLPDDFTLPLLEKAYAKLHGSYGAALRGEGDSLTSALGALSGGVVQSFAPPRQPLRLLLQVLLSALPRATIVVAMPTSQEKDRPGRRLRNGLIACQAYCVTAVTRDGSGALLRLRAPSGRGEWTGTAPSRPGHFWMPLERFATAFGRLELVHVGPDEWACEPTLRLRRPWRAVLARRRWRVGYNAGGPPTASTAAANPYFQLLIPRGDACHAVVALAQRPTRGRPHAIGLSLYELPADAAAGRALSPALRSLRALEVRHECEAQEVAAFFTLPAGRYLLLPYTGKPHISAAFLLRVLTDRPTDIWEANDDNAIIRDVAAEFERDAWPLPRDMRTAHDKLLKNEETDEVDGEMLAAALRGRVPAETCRALVALRDTTLSGRASRDRVPALLALAAAWREVVARATRRRRVNAYGLRSLLRECGVSVSNKVLEGLVLRFARGAVLSATDCVLALARLHLAHERYRCVTEANPFSLEEMILMTIYS